MTNIFEIKLQYNETISEAYHIIKDSMDFINDSELKLLKLSQKLSEKQVNYTTFMITEFDLEKLEGHDEVLELYNDAFNKVGHLKSYSKFNPIFVMKRFYKTRKQLNKGLHEIKKVVRYIGQAIKNIEQQLLQFKKQNFEIRRMLNIIQDCKDDLAKIRNKKLYDIDNAVIQLEMMLFMNDATISKNEMLSMLNVARDSYTKEIIDDMPSQIDKKSFWKYVFVYKIEEENNDWCSQMLFNEMLNMRDKSPEYKKQMDKAVYEVFDGKMSQLPKYNVSFDEYGEIEDIERMPVELSVIQGNKRR